MLIDERFNDERFRELLPQDWFAPGRKFSTSDYLQVLQDFWKPWGHTLFEIIKDPTNPISYFTPPSLPETN